MSKYTVRYDRDETGWWVASVKGVRGCHTQGRTIEQARRRIREALSLFVDDSENAALTDDVRLSPELRNLLNEVKSGRERVAKETAKLQRSTAKAIATLLEDIGMSTRDASELLGLSHQRVHQLAPKKKVAYSSSVKSKKRKSADRVAEGEIQRYRTPKNP